MKSAGLDGAPGMVQCFLPGGVAEWLMAPVLKTGNGKPFVGSNPTPSAIFQVSQAAEPS